MFSFLDFQWTTVNCENSGSVDKKARLLVIQLHLSYNDLRCYFGI